MKSNNIEPYYGKYSKQILDRVKKFKEDIHINDLNVKTRTYMAFYHNGISFLSEILQLSEKELLKLEKFGKVSLEDLKINLRDLGLSENCLGK